MNDIIKIGNASFVRSELKKITSKKALMKQYKASSLREEVYLEAWNEARGKMPAEELVKEQPEELNEES